MFCRTLKERLRGYFRLSNRSCDNNPESSGNQRSSNASITQEATTETCDERTISVGDPAFNFHKPTKNQAEPIKTSVLRKTFQSTAKPKCGITRSTEVRPNHLPPSSQRLVVDSLVDTQELLNNSCSNITASTYCNGVDPSQLIGKGETPDRDRFHDNPISDSIISQKERRAARSALYNHPLRTSQDSDLDSILSRRESSSTFERDMDIIDLLQRERSMDIPEALERDHRIGMESKRSSISRQNSSHDRHHRRLPDLRRLTGTPVIAKKSVEPHFPNQVFTYQPNEVLIPANVLPSGRGVAVVAAAVAAQSNRSAQGPYSSLTKRDSISSMLGTGSSHRLVELDPIHPAPLVKRSEYREQRLSSNHSGHSLASNRSGSLKGRHRNSRGSSGVDYTDTVFAPNL